MPLPDMPVLFFPQPQSKPIPPKKSLPIPQAGHPSFSQQIKRIGAQFDRLNTAFEKNKVDISNSATGIIPEATLVIYTRGSNADFANACRQVGFELLGEFDEYDLPEDDSFYVEKVEKDGTIKGRKPLTQGKLFLTFSDLSAKDKLLSLWNQYCNNEPFKRGTGEWKKIFPYIDSIKVWSAKERLDEFRIIDDWKERLADTIDKSPIRFEIELWCHQEKTRQERTIAETTTIIHEKGGAVFGQSVTIPEIRFQAIRAELPKEILRNWIDAYENGHDENVGFFGYKEIRYFRPMGQCAVSMETGELDTPYQPESVSGLPLIAIFDGHPLAHHRLLNDKMIIDDPDDFNSKYNNPKEYQHGTAIASLVLHGDLNDSTPLQRPIYLRPVLYPNPKARIFDKISETIPDELFPEDLVLRAVKRMFDGENDELPVAPTVKIINISLGDSEKPFINSISSWGRLLDWLSWKYKVLFIVSAGNYTEPPVKESLDAFQARSEDDQLAATVRFLHDNTRVRTILAPSDSVNALCIGARHFDSVTDYNQLGSVDLLPNTELMSPVSSHGPGYRRCMKPEIIFPGGRQLYHEDLSHNITIARQALTGPGIRAASPGEPGQLNYSCFSCGTSNAAALASNAAGLIYEMLLELDQTDSYIHDQISDTTIAPLLKTLIVHSAFKGEALGIIEQILDSVLPNRKKKEHISRFMGYGNADVLRVLKCLANRGTVIGCGEIRNEQIHEYQMPLPSCLSGQKELKRVIISVGWISPINHIHHQYRRAQISMITPNLTTLDKKIGVDSCENDHNQIERGTVIHSVFEGKKVRELADNDFLKIQIQCEDKAGGLNDPVPYGIAVTIEAINTVTLPVYSQIKQGIEVIIKSRVKVGLP